MSERDIRFPEYGQAGDNVSARRIRHAFRYLVLALLLLTFGLWLSENYLRYTKAERLYRMALTHERDSARALLRNLVPEGGEVPQDPRLARYLAALAFIEDSTDERERLGIHEEYAVDPLVIERYEQALQADRRSEFILLSYGCALFLDAQYTRARDRFRDARSVTDQPNALSAYLEAAARAAVGEMAEALSLVRQTNGNTEARLRMPEPLWHASMPRRGMWYARVRDEVTERFLAPLFTMKNQVLGRIALEQRGAGADDAARPLDADAWLRHFELLGKRLAGESPGQDGAPVSLMQVRAGIHFEYEALRLRQQVEPGGGPAGARLETLKRARARLDDFAAGREARIAAHEGVVARPVRLYTMGLLVLGGFYVFSYLLAKRVHAGRMYWSLAHPAWGRAAILAMAAGLTVLLFAFTVIMRVTLAPTPWLAGCTYAWYGLVALLAGFGCLYPALLLSPARRVVMAHESGGPSGELLRHAQRARRTAYVSMLRRYFGVVMGVYLAVFCVWMLGFRILTGLYPVLERKLLVTGLLEQEWEVVRQVQQLLL